MAGQVSTANPNMVQGTAGAPLTVGFASGNTSPLYVLNRASRYLDEQNIPSDNRWCVAPPVFWEKVQDESSKLIGVDWQSSASDQSILRNGRVLNGKLRGFDCFRSNNMPLDSSSNYQIMMGHMSSTASASQIAKVEKFRSPTSFTDVVRGLHMFGRKALRPTAMALAHFTVS
jgi:small nuclear ribonucleoprotein (snRNP)-like protein